MSTQPEVDQKPIYLTSEDGKTHINVSAKGRSSLGVILTPGAKTNLRIEGDGYFSSVEGYWHWLRTGKKHQVLRQVFGVSARSVGSKLLVVEHSESEVLEKLRKATWMKIEKDPWCLKGLKKNKLPFTAYLTYGMGDVVIKPATDLQWLVDYLNGLRAQWDAEALQKASQEKSDS